MQNETQNPAPDILKPAHLPQHLIDKVQALEDEIRGYTMNNTVLLAYDNRESPTI